MSRKGSHVRTAAARTSSSAGQPSPLSRRRRAREASVQRSSRMRFDNFSFDSIQIDGSTYEHDVVIDRGEVSKRKKKPSKKFRDGFGHTPLSIEEKIPWKCSHLVIGTGEQGALPVMPQVLEEAKRRGVKVAAVKTTKAIELLQGAGVDTNAVLHITG